MMATRRPREGSLLRIDLGDGRCAFARVLAKSQVAIYGHLGSDTKIVSEAVFDSPVLWQLTVMKSALTSGRWNVVDHRPLEPKLTEPVEYFIKDRLSGRYSVYRSSDGLVRESTFEECKSLEPAAAWDAEHVEDRIRDHFAGRPNVWVEQAKPAL